MIDLSNEKEMKTHKLKKISRWGERIQINHLFNIKNIQLELIVHYILEAHLDWDVRKTYKSIGRKTPNEYYSKSNIYNIPMYRRRIIKERERIQNEREMKGHN